MKWSTWSAKGGKRDDVDILSHTLASGKETVVLDDIFIVLRSQKIA